jgi:hypothetical protein
VYRLLSIWLLRVVVQEATMVEAAAVLVGLEHQHLLFLQVFLIP